MRRAGGKTARRSGRVGVIGEGATRQLPDGARRAMCGSDMGAQPAARRFFRGKLGRCGRAIRAVPAKRDLPERTVVFGTNFVSGKEGARRKTRSALKPTALSPARSG